MSFIQIDGRSIAIRDWKLEDLPIYEQWNTGKHRWMDFNGPYYERMSAAEVQQSIVNTRKQIHTHSFQNPRSQLVIADKDSGKLLGTCGWYWQSIETNWMSQGLVIYDDAFWGKGIGYEALGIWCDYLLGAFPKIVRLDLRTWSGNHGMMKLAKKLGFQLEACFRDARIIDGQYFDSIGYGVLRKDWRALYPQGFDRHLSQKPE